jgi:hypothetical protein
LGNVKLSSSEERKSMRKIEKIRKSPKEERAFNSANPPEKIESKLAEASGVQLAK